MTKGRIIAIILVIGAGLAGSYYIIKTSVSSPDAASAQKNSLNNPNSQDIIAKNPINWLAQAINSAGGLLGGENNPSDNTPNDNTKSQNPQNLTELVAGSLFNQMKTLDQSGQSPAQAFDSSSTQSQELLNQAVASISDPSLMFAASVNDKDLKISNDNSKEAKLVYLENVRQIARNRVGSSKYVQSADQVIQSINNECFGGSAPSLNQEIADAFKNLVNDQTNLAVPSGWIDIHEEIITFLKKSELVYQSLADCKKDPIKGYLAARVLPKLIEQTFTIQKTLFKNYQTVSN